MCAAPVLYERVVVEDIDLFLVGLDQSRAITASNNIPHLTKLALFSFVKHINIISPLPHTVVLYRDLLQANIWEDPIERSMQAIACDAEGIHATFVERVQEWEHIVQNIQSSQGSQLPILPQLQAITLGSTTLGLWRPDPDRRRFDYMRISLEREKSNNTFSAFLRLLQPRSICARGVAGPHMQVYSRDCRSTHFLHVPYPLATLFVGTRNIIFLADRSVYPPNERYGYAGIGRTVGRILATTIKGLQVGRPGNTLVELYGVYRNMAEGTKHGDGSPVWEKAEDEREAALQAKHGERDILGALDDEWRSVVTLGLWKDRPVCPGCEGRTEMNLRSRHIYDEWMFTTPGDASTMYM
jgi:hypothetical protein